MGSTKNCVSNNNMPPSNKTFPGTVIMTVSCVLIIYHYIYNSLIHFPNVSAGITAFISGIKLIPLMKAVNVWKMDYIFI
jgi:hypothetical protein